MALTLLFALPVAADSPTNKETLLESDFATLIDLARQAYEAEDYEAAVEGLVMANRRDPNPRLLLNIARSHDRNGDCRTSLAYLEAFLRHPAAEESLVESTEESLQEGIDQCSAYSEDMGGRLSLETEPLLASVSINGAHVGTTPTEIAGLAPGSHTLRFELEGYADHVEEIEVVAHQDQTVGVVLQEPDDSDDQILDPIAQPGSQEDSDPELNYIALGLIGGGAALAITGAVFDLVLIPQTDEQRSALDQQTQAEEFAELSQKRKTQANLALAGYIGGGLLIVGGASWLIYEMMTTEDDGKIAAGWSITPDANSNGFGFTLLGRF